MLRNAWRDARRPFQQAGIKLPNRRVHAALQAIVETQVAMGDETEAQATLIRLLSEGLDRHDAIHAIGDVLAEHMYNLQKGQRLATQTKPTPRAYVI